jgi:cytoskeletal protein CcmA (bactofilin family)
MWNKPRQEKITRCDVLESTSAPLATRPLANGKDGTLVPNAQATPDSSVGAAPIGKSVKFVGQIYSKEDLSVDGRFEGTIEAIAHRLTIGPTGDVHAGIKAHDVVVLGMLEGNVEAADRLEIGRNARVVGDIRTARIYIEDGAYIKGSIDIIKPEPLRAPTNSAAVVLATAPNQEAIAVAKASDEDKDD